MAEQFTREIRGVVANGSGVTDVESFTLGSPQGREVLVRIKASGVCHTDLDHASLGKPLILGHEGAGVVEAVGEQVSGFAPGDRVMLNWAIPCGTCFQCKRKAKNLCERRPGVPAERFSHRLPYLQPMFGLGTLAEMALVPVEAVLRIPESLPYPVAAIMGCAVMTGYGSVVNVAEVSPGESVVILGCGGVGLSVLLAAALAGASPIIAVDVVESKLEKARQLGATSSILASRSDTGLVQAASHVKGMTGGRGADVAFECTAVPELGVAPLAMVRNGGMAVAVSGIEQTIQADMELFEFDKWYINPLYGACVPERDFPRIIAHYESGELDLDSLIFKTYSLDEAGLAFDALRSGGSGKGVVVF
jgi:S-(hydroxymethyl)glutathione dehydrogenase/alcohol dehydrogenase